jgi:hypothetical protein
VKLIIQHSVLPSVRMMGVIPSSSHTLASYAPRFSRRRKVVELWGRTPPFDPVRTLSNQFHVLTFICYDPFFWLIH